MYCVYKHTAPNGKIYIGITSINPLKRWANGQGYKHNNHFWNAIQKYGWDNIKHEILYSDLTKEEACQKEIELIARYKSNQREFGYNIENGGNAIGKISEETKAYLREINLGKHHTKESCEKMSKSRKGQIPWNKGKHMPAGTGKKAGLKQSIKTYQFSKEGKFIATYKSVREASRITGLQSGAIGLCCNGKLKTVGGYVWRH